MTTWRSECCERPPVDEVDHLHTGRCAGCKEGAMFYDEDAISQPEWTTGETRRLLTDFEHDTIQRNREQVAILREAWGDRSAFLAGLRPADGIAGAEYWPQDTREREASRALELDIMDATHHAADAAERDWMRQGRD